METPQDPMPKEYLDAIRAELKAATDDWTDQQLDDYAYDPSGWQDYYADGYSARDAVHEDMSYWEPA